MSYESQMVGQKPSSKAPKNNYEGSEMRGEKGHGPSKSADGTTGRISRAAGGVAKMRHNQADMKGMPKPRPPHHKLGE